MKKKQEDRKTLRTFPDQEGDYEKPNLIISGGYVLGDIPDIIDCPSVFVVYSSWAEHVDSCQGYRGPNAGNNSIVQQARQNAEAAVSVIKCAEPCKKKVAEIWRGWDCSFDRRIKRNTALAGVEFKIYCEIEL